MAGIFPSTTQKIGDYFTFTGNQCLSPEEQNTTNSSTISWASNSPTINTQDLDLDFVNEIFSNTSSITTPTTSVDSDPDLPSAVLNSRRSKPLDKVEEPIREEDFGTFEDWLRWDEPETQSTTSMNRSNTTPPTQTDDSVVFIEDPVSNSPLFQPRNFNSQPSINTRIDNASTSFDNLNLVGIPPQATIFNSPPQLAAAPSWPQPQQQYIQPTFFTSILSPQEEARLRSIAMPQLNASSVFSSTTDYRSSLSPSDHGHVSKRPALNSNSSSRRTTQRKRKSTAEDSIKYEPTDAEEDYSFNVEEPSPSSSSAAGTAAAAPVANVTKGKKTSHNMIEKRYRNNLNDKIAELRDSVPSLRVMSKHGNQGGSDDEDEEEDLDGLTPAHRLNKATILSKATEYINHLERRNDHLSKENAGLKARVDAFEILLMSRQQSAPIQGGAYNYASTQQQQQGQGQGSYGW